MTRRAAWKGCKLAAAFWALQSAALFAPRGAKAQTPAQPAPFADVIEELAPRLGYAGAYRIETKSLAGGEQFRVAKVTFDDGSRRTAVVIKKLPRRTTFVRGLPFVAIPALRLRRLLTSATELKATIEMTAAFRAAGLKTMDILLVIPQRRIIATRFLEGATGMDKVVLKAAEGDQESLLLVEELGRKLAQAHRAGLEVGDMSPANTMAVDGEIYFTDLDHASRNGNKTFDIAVFLVKQAGDYRPSSAASAGGQDTLVTRAFLKGYLENGGSAKDVERARRLNYKVLSLQYLKAPEARARIRRHMAEMGNVLRRPAFDR